MNEQEQDRMATRLNALLLNDEQLHAALFDEVIEHLGWNPKYNYCIGCEGDHIHAFETVAIPEDAPRYDEYWAATSIVTLSALLTVANEYVPEGFEIVVQPTESE
jgi:hypothetical protein